MDFEELIPIVAIMMPVMIVWISLHYGHKKRQLNHMSDDQLGDLDRMARVAEKMERRINTLEAILDDEVPEWRKKND